MLLSTRREHVYQYIYVCTRTRTHAHTHTRTHAHKHTRTHAHACARAPDLVVDPATDTVAGGRGTDENCLAVYRALGEPKFEDGSGGGFTQLTKSGKGAKGCYLLEAKGDDGPSLRRSETTDFDEACGCARLMCACKDGRVEARV